MRHETIAYRFTRRLTGSLTVLGTVLGSASAVAVALVCLAASTSACDKPREADCKKAVANIRRIYGTQGMEFGVDPRAMVRSCRGSANRSSVQCFITAKTMEDLQACEGGTFQEMFADEAGDAQPAATDTDTKTPGTDKTPDTEAKPVTPSATPSTGAIPSTGATPSTGVPAKQPVPNAQPTPNTGAATPVTPTTPATPAPGAQ